MCGVLESLVQVRRTIYFRRSVKLGLPAQFDVPRQVTIRTLCLSCVFRIQNNCALHWPGIEPGPPARAGKYSTTEPPKLTEYWDASAIGRKLLDSVGLGS